MKMTMTATELKDTDVEFVSMVKNGANRLPFRVVKSENEEVFDLAKVAQRAFKKADVAPAIIAVSMTKAADAGHAVILKHAGLDENDVVRTERDDLVTYTKKSETARDGTDVMAVMMKGDVALMVTGLQKGFSGYDWESTDFGTVMGSGGYCTGVATAGDMLDLTIANILTKVESPSEASNQVGAAIDAFRDYVVKLTSGLPVQAFKAEIELSKADFKSKLLSGTASVAKGDWDMKDGDKPDGWEAMSDDDKSKMKAKMKSTADQTKKSDFDLKALPAVKPVWMTKGAFDAMTLLKHEAAQEALEKGDPCWEGYEQVGTKDKDGKKVPNCVPKGSTKKTDMPLEKPAFMSKDAYAALYKAETGIDWPQGDLTQGHGGGFDDKAMAANTSAAATEDEKRNVPKNLGNDTQTPGYPLAVHKSTYEAMKKSGATPEALFAFCKAVTFDPTKDQSVSGASMGDGAPFADAAMAKQPATDDKAMSIDEKARRALGMVTMTGTKKADDTVAHAHGGKNPITDPAQALSDDLSGAGRRTASEEAAAVLEAAQKSAKESEDRILQALGVMKKDFEGSITTLGTRLDDVTKKVTKAEAAISGTVLGEAPGDEHEEGRRMLKTEGNARVPALLDTGFDRRDAA